jgi:hypothetical protein
MKEVNTMDNVDMDDVGLFIKSMQTAIGLVSSMQNILKGKKIDKAQINLQMSELSLSLADANNRIAEIQTLLIEKNQEISDLKQKLEVKEKVTFKHPYYYLEGNENEPYCQCCYDANGKLVRIQLDYGGASRNGYCAVCKSGYVADSDSKRPEFYDEFED